MIRRAMVILVVLLMDFFASSVAAYAGVTAEGFDAVAKLCKSFLIKKQGII
ncbi:MAG: hypothetical protein ACOX47_01525 [Bacillota bacterium]|jgi:hypothetical protein